MSKIRILAIPSDQHGVGKYRINDPFNFIKINYEEEVSVDVVPDVPNSDLFFKNYDIVVFHSFIHKTTHEDNISRIKWLQKLGIKVVMDSDDYWSVDQRHPMHSQIVKNEVNKKKIEMMQTVDYVTTTTPFFTKSIKDKLRVKNVLVFPNAINPEEPQFQPNPIKSEKLRFGWLGGSCLTPDTEILTENGWKFFEDLKKERVCTLNPNTNEIEYHEPYGYIKEKHNGAIYICDTNNVSFSVTPNHNMYISPINYLGHKKLNFNLSQCENIKHTNFHVKKDGINTNIDVDYFILPEIKHKRGDSKDYYEKKILMDDWLSFFGFWIAEGWTDFNNKSTSICQFKENDYLKTFEDFFKKYGFISNYVKNKGTLRVCDRQLFEYLNQFGKAPDKYIPRELLNTLSERQLRILLTWYLNGDGSKEVTGSYTRHRGHTVSKQLSDDLMEISFKIGDCSSIKNRGIRQTKTSIKGRLIKSKHNSFQIGFYSKNSKHNKLNPLVRKEDIKTENYNGYVYCVNVKNNIIYVRRNGKPLWVGNSHLYDIELMTDGISRILTNHKDNVQFVLCGFDTRGFIYVYDKQNKTNSQRPIEPKETVWFKYENVFTKYYTSLDEEYKNYLMELSQRDFNDLNKPYIRRWTKEIGTYATNYNYFDVSLAPLVDTVFNNNKSELKIIESGFHKKPVIASDVIPYSDILINAFDQGKFNENGNALLVSPSKNHKQWDQHMNKFINNPNLIEDLGNKLYETVKDKYSLPNVCKDRVEFLKSIIN